MPLSKDQIASLLARKTLQTHPNLEVSGSGVNQYQKTIIDGKEVQRLSSSEKLVLHGSDYIRDEEDRGIIQTIQDSQNPGSDDTLLNDLQQMDSVSDYNAYADELTPPPNVSQFTNFQESKTNINLDLADQILDNDVYELLPQGLTRQQRIDLLFSEILELLGPIPSFQGSYEEGYFYWSEDELSYLQTNDISYMQDNGIDDSEAFITRTIDPTIVGGGQNGNNENKSIEYLRNLLNLYLLDIDYPTPPQDTELEDYENQSEGYQNQDSPGDGSIIAGDENENLDFEEEEEVDDCFPECEDTGG